MDTVEWDRGGLLHPPLRLSKEYSHVQSQTGTA